MPRRNLTIAVVWLTLCGAAFVQLFAVDAASDGLGYVIGLVTLQLPAFAAVVDAPYDRPLEAGRGIVVGFTGACAGTYSMLIALSGNSLAGEIILLLFVALAVGLTLLLTCLPHPRGGRIAFTVMLALSLVAVVATLAVAEGRPPLTFVVAWVVPWPVPLLLLCWWPRPSIAPVVRVVR